MSGAFDCFHELTLMPCTCPRYAFGNDSSLFADESEEFLFIFIIDVNLFIVAKFTRPFFPRRNLFVAKARSRRFEVLSFTHDTKYSPFGKRSCCLSQIFILGHIFIHLVIVEERLSFNRCGWRWDGGFHYTWCQW